jgi:hypothetical protein
MPPYDDWNKIDDEEDEELQDASVSYSGVATPMAATHLLYSLVYCIASGDQEGRYSILY